jgi:crotonobetainyl-CoA:carnitine CoA-transferase CaiB-like acyl-CoA transferase
MADVIGAPELVTDPRFQERDERKKNRKALTPLVEEKLRQKPTAHWVEALNARDVPSGDILSLEDALAQPQVQHRQVLQTVKVGGDIGDVPVFGLTARLSKTPGEVTSPPPRLGAHTEEVLLGVGYTNEQIAALKQKGIV